MMATATPGDIAQRLGRPLNPAELLTVEALLEDSEVEIRRYGAGAKLGDPAWRQAIVAVECDMVLRASRLASKTANLVPYVETVDNAADPATRSATYGSVFLTRGNRRTLGLTLNGVVALTPNPAVDTVFSIRRY